MIWTGERNRQQGRLVAEMYQAAAGVPCERSAAIAGGLPGADKAAALGKSGVDRSQYLTISIDAVLDRMAAAGLIPESDGLSPLARAGLVHAEAQYLAKRVGLRALMDGRNLLLDISLASWRAAEAWTYALRFADYAVAAVFADIGADEAVRRSGEACRRGRRTSAAATATGAGTSRPRPSGRWPARPPPRPGTASGGRSARGPPGHRRHRRHRDLSRQRRDRDARFLPERPAQPRRPVARVPRPPLAAGPGRLSARTRAGQGGHRSTPSPTSPARSTMWCSATTSAGCPTPTTTSWPPRPTRARSRSGN